MRGMLRVAALCAVIALLAASPAFAHRSAAKLGSTVAVTEGAPSEFTIKVAPNVVKSGVITFKVTNKGKLSHDFKLCSSPAKGLTTSCAGRTTKMLSPGQSDTLRVTVVRKGSYEYLCTVPGHAAAGMRGLIKVT